MPIDSDSLSLPDLVHSKKEQEARVHVFVFAASIKTP